VFGEAHPDVAIDLNNLGSVCYALGETQKAKTLFEQSLAIKLQFYEADHPSVLMAKEWLENF
jgi:Tfp pilus assembly protein PilF